MLVRGVGLFCLVAGSQGKSISPYVCACASTANITRSRRHTLLCCHRRMNIEKSFRLTFLSLWAHERREVPASLSDFPSNFFFFVFFQSSIFASRKSHAMTMSYQSIALIFVDVRVWLCPFCWLLCVYVYVSVTVGNGGDGGGGVVHGCGSQYVLSYTSAITFLFVCTYTHHHPHFAIKRHISRARIPHRRRCRSRHTRYIIFSFYQKIKWNECLRSVFMNFSHRFIPAPPLARPQTQRLSWNSKWHGNDVGAVGGMAISNPSRWELCRKNGHNATGETGRREFSSLVIWHHSQKLVQWTSPEWVLSNEIQFQQKRKITVWDVPSTRQS